MRQIAFTVKEVCSLGCGKVFHFFNSKWGESDGEETQSEEGSQENEEEAVVANR
jgi:hypothetical protein